MPQVPSSNPFLSEAQTKQRRFELLLCMIVGFMFNLDASIVQPTAAFYVKAIDLVRHTPSSMDNILYGWVISAFYISRFVFGPILGAVGERLLGNRVTITLSLLVCAGGNLLYALAPDVWALILGRALNGLGGASVACILNYIAGVTMPEERGPTISSYWGVATLGLVGGPGIGLLFTFIPTVWNQYIAPAYFMLTAMVLVAIGFFLLFRDLSRDLNLKAPGPLPWMPVPWSCRLLFVLFFLFGFALTSFETLLVPYSAAKFNWTAEINAGVLLGIGGLVVISLVILRLLQACVPPRALLVTASALMSTGALMSVVYPNEGALPATELALFVVGAVTITMGYSFAVSLVPAEFTRFLGPHPYRGMLIGLLQSSLALARCFSPIFVGYTLGGSAASNVNAVFITLVVLLACNAILAAVIYRVHASEVAPADTAHASMLSTKLLTDDPEPINATDKSSA